MTSDDIVQLWLKHPAVSESMKKAINQMSAQEKKVAFANTPLAFGTAGIRTKMGPGPQYLNKFVYQQMAYGYGQYLKIKFHNQQIKVIVAHDNRNNGISFSEIIGDTLSWMGIDVYYFANNQLMPTPLVSYAIKKLKMHGAVIVTASHNPKEDNGFKVYKETGAQILPQDAKIIIQQMPASTAILDLKPKRDNHNIHFIDDTIINDYFAAAKGCLIHTDTAVKKSMPIVFTGLHGTACKLLPSFLSSLGYNIIPVTEQCEFDGNFSATNCNNPEFKEAFTLAYQYADQVKSNIIIAVDPDADRFAVALRKNKVWHHMSGNDMGIIYTYYVLKNKKFTKTPYIVSSYVSTNLIDEIAKSFHAEVIRVGTGFKWMGNKIDEIGSAKEFVVAFEEAIGALNSPINRDKDSFQAAALTLEIITYYQAQNKDLIDLLHQEIMSQYGTCYNKTISIVIKDLQWKTIADTWMKKLSAFDNVRVLSRQLKQNVWNDVGDCLDWILTDNSWIRFRKSGTEPKFKIYFNLYGKKYSDLINEAQKIEAYIRMIIGA